MSDIAIKVENLSKYYRLGVINSGTLSRDLQSWIYKRLGKEDPNKRIGSRESDAEGFWALKDLNFEIKKGDRVGIIGHNGAGKSTLLKMLSQISSPTNGKIYIDGKIASLLEVGTGFNPELTGRENIYLNGAILGMKKKEVDRKIDEIIAFSEIERHIDTPVKRYSSGMYVRLAFAVAAHLDSDILIADEVLAVGDASFQKKALGKMNELSTGQGRTVLFVSHNMSQVKNLCNKGIVLNRGGLAFYGNLNNAINYYVDNFIDKKLSVKKIYGDDLTKDFQLKQVSILNSNKECVDLYEAQELNYIEMIVTSRKPIPGLYGYFQILNSENIPIVEFDSNESSEGCMCDLPKGDHLFTFEIPKGVLNHGRYFLYVNFTSQFNLSNFNVDSPLHCCSFNVQDSKTGRGAVRIACTGKVLELV